MGNCLLGIGWMALVMGCDATPPPDATANIPAPMACGCGCYLRTPLPLFLLSVSGSDLSSSPDIHCIHRQQRRLPLAVAAPRHRLRLRCSCLSCCAALSFRRPSGDGCFSKPGSPIRFATTHTHRTGPCRIAFAESTPTFCPPRSPPAFSRPAAAHLEAMAEMPGRY